MRSHVEFSSRAREREYECTEKHNGHEKNAPIGEDSLARVPGAEAPCTEDHCKPGYTNVPNKIADAREKPRDTFVGATCVGVSLPYK